ncbi:hypothetical protein QBC43DRAFT_373750 [Cladorrhinum sp. PSN259]|nr:hypothetical protein QBC43DRAFT_373750 [Cladorrhinum sp. PSN259]
MSILPGAPLPIPPIYNIAPELLITGALRNHTVYITGSVSGGLSRYDWTSHSAGQQSIPFINSPQVGEYIFVHQCKTGGGPETCSHKSNGFNYQVLPEPTPLPMPSVTIPMHTCADGIGLADLVPGARIRAYLKPQGQLVLDEIIKSSTTGYYHLKDGITYTGGSTLDIWQTTKRQDGRHLDPPSIIDKSPPYTNPLDQIKYNLPALCMNSVHLDNMLNGATISFNAPECWRQGTFHNSDPTQRAYTLTPACENVDLWTKPGRFEAYQSFPRCDLKSEPVGVDIKDMDSSFPLSIATPTLERFCTGTTSLTINLYQLFFTPELLRVERYVGDQLDDAFWWPVTEAGEITLEIPAEWTQPDPRGPVSLDFQMALDSTDSECQKRVEAKYYSEFYGHRLPLDVSEKGAIAPPPKLYPDTVYSCSRILVLGNGYVGSEVQIQDSQGTMYSSWITVRDKSQVIRLFRDLKPNSVARALVRGCGVTKKESNPIKVIPLVGRLPQPVLEPLRPGDTEIVASGLVVGAKLAIWISEDSGGQPSIYNAENTRWAPEYEATSTSHALKLNVPLKSNWKANVIQTLCSEAQSTLNTLSTYTTVTRATLSITVESNPPPLKKGQQYGIHIHAVDSGRPNIKNSPRFGQVTLDAGVSGSFAFGSYQSFLVPASSPLTQVTGSVPANEYHEAASFRIALTKADPTAISLTLATEGTQFSTFLLLTVDPQNPICTYTLSKVEYTVTPDWTGGQTYTKSGGPTPSPRGTIYVAGVELPMPQGSPRERKLQARAKATYDISGPGKCSGLKLEDVYFGFDGFIGDARESGKFCVKWSAAFRYVDSGDGVSMVRQWVWGTQAPPEALSPGLGMRDC